MSHTCHRFWKCDKTLTFCSLLPRCTIPCACHTKRHLNLKKWTEPGVLRTFWLRNVLRATTACAFLDTATSKSGPNMMCVLYILTWKCASRHNGVHFFDITSSKSLRCVLYILTWTCASRHNGVHHFSSLTWPDGSAPAALASLLVDPAEPQIIGKTQCFATFLPCVILFLLTLSLLWSSLFYSSLLSDPFHLCFSSVHIVGSLSLTSKLPSMTVSAKPTSFWKVFRSYSCNTKGTRKHLLFFFKRYSQTQTMQPKKVWC